MFNENVIKQCIYVGDINPAMEDFNSNGGGMLSPKVRRLGHGTCIVQKVAGLTMGVYKDAYLIIVKYDTTLPHGLSALRKVIEDLEGRRENGEDV